eukprot:10453082-Karenia_brevis.AAC.1
MISGISSPAFCAPIVGNPDPATAHGTHIFHVDFNNDDFFAGLAPPAVSDAIAEDGNCLSCQELTNIGVGADADTQCYLKDFNSQEKDS